MDAPPDDVDQTCAAGLTDQCLGRPPGPCPDLSDGMERVVSFAGFQQDHAPSCAGAMTGATGANLNNQRLFTRDLVKAGYTNVIVGTAGTEQKGPHMVDGEHKFVMTWTAGRIARGMGKTRA